MLYGFRNKSSASISNHRTSYQQPYCIERLSSIKKKVESIRTKTYIGVLMMLPRCIPYFCQLIVSRLFLVRMCSRSLQNYIMKVFNFKYIKYSYILSSILAVLYKYYAVGLPHISVHIYCFSTFTSQYQISYTAYKTFCTVFLHVLYSIRYDKLHA